MAAHDLAVAAEHSDTSRKPWRRAGSRVAIGITVGHVDVPVEVAFRVLSDRSQRSNTKLRDLARGIVDRHR